MRCFFILVHGRLSWPAEPALAADPEAFRPLGFYCHRYVLASDVDQAKEKAFRRVRNNLEKQTGWVSKNSARLEFEAEEVTDAPMHKLLKRDNRGHTFY